MSTAEQNALQVRAESRASALRHESTIAALRTQIQGQENTQFEETQLHQHVLEDMERQMQQECETLVSRYAEEITGSLLEHETTVQRGENANDRLNAEVRDFQEEVNAWAATATSQQQAEASASQTLAPVASGRTLCRSVDSLHPTLS